jgi:multicomponent Na+:H+ antiporter subunit B
MLTLLQIFILIITVYMIGLRHIIQIFLFSSIISIFSTFIYLILHAPDLAVTEIAIGVGANSIIFLLSLLNISKVKIGNYSKIATTIDSNKYIKSMIIAIIIFGSLFFPYIIMPSDDLLHISTQHQRLYDLYITNAIKDFDFPSIVTAIVVGYRGFDTLFESIVVFTATAGFAFVLKKR